MLELLVVEEKLLRKEFIVLGPALPHDSGSGHHVSQVDPGTGHLALPTGLHGPYALSRFPRSQLFLGYWPNQKLGPTFC